MQTTRKTTIETHNRRGLPPKCATKLERAPGKQPERSTYSGAVKLRLLVNGVFSETLYGHLPRKKKGHKLDKNGALKVRIACITYFPHVHGIVQGTVMTIKPSDIWALYPAAEMHGENLYLNE